MNNAKWTRTDKTGEKFLPGRWYAFAADIVNLCKPDSEENK